MSISERRRLLRAAQLLLEAAYALDEADEHKFVEFASRASQNLADARRPLTRAGDLAQEIQIDKFTPEGRER